MINEILMFDINIIQRINLVSVFLAVPTELYFLNLFPFIFGVTRDVHDGPGPGPGTKISF